MAESRTDDVNEMNVDCSIQNCSRGSVTLGDDNDDDNVNNEKSRDQNNMAEPIEVTNNVESLFLASMHQNSQMIKTLTRRIALIFPTRYNYQSGQFLCFSNNV
jgi:hypothetical protein